MAAAAREREGLIDLVAHELRSPLNGIRTWVHVLEGRLAGADAGVARALEGIRNGVERQARQLDDLHDLARALDGRLALSVQPAALAPIVAAAARNARAIAPGRTLELAFEPALERREIPCDADRLETALTYFLAYALNVTPEGGAARCTASIEGEGARIEIAFPEARIAPGGAGTRSIALALAEQLVELHEGRLAGEATRIVVGIQGVRFLAP